MLISQIEEFLTQGKSIGIALGKNAGIDETAAGLSLYLSLLQSGRMVSIAKPQEPLVEESFLVGIDKIKNNFSSDNAALVVSFPYKDGEIDKVSYTKEEGFLNIVVRPTSRGLSFSERDIRFSREGGSVDTLFVVGTPTLSDLGGLFDTDALKETRIINIDNKPHNQSFGDALAVLPQASSVSEIVADFIFTMGFGVDADVAQNLLYGISAGTNNFQNPKTSALAFEMVSLLLKKGAVRKDIKSQAPQDIDSIFSPQPQRGAQQEASGRIIQNRPQHDSSRNKPQRPQDARRFGGKAPQDKRKSPPEDWLTPKIYKGSTNI